jgi:hypothetical protein
VVVWPGNPADSSFVAGVVDGYGKCLSEHGYRPQSAVPWMAEDVLKVTLHMAEQLRAESGVARVLVARDLFCLCVMWRCVSRGVTAVEWRLSDVQLLDGTLPTLPTQCMIPHDLESRSLGPSPKSNGQSDRNPVPPS